MARVPKCPRCGSTRINMLSDAWVVRSVVGVDENGEPIVEPDQDVREFQHTEFECGEPLARAEAEIQEVSDA